VFRDGATHNADMTLVGVIADVKYSGLERPADNAIFRPFAQQPWPNVYLIARTKDDTRALVLALQRRITQVDPGIVVTAVKSLDDVVLDAAAQPRLRTLLTAGLATLTLLLAAVGLYGVISRSVTQRTNEFGIRMALGARSIDIVRMVVGEGMLLAGVGVALGSALGYVAARLFATLLFGITPTDVVSFTLAGGCSLVFALCASYLPARKATRVDPAIALRAE
jgi:putative ABC transport system permease protein